MGQPGAQAMGAPPQWCLDVYNLHAGRVARQFILHFNINDLVIDLAEEAQDPSTTPPRRIRRGAITTTPQNFRAYLHS